METQKPTLLTENRQNQTTFELADPAKLEILHPVCKFGGFSAGR